VGDIFKRFCFATSSFLKDIFVIKFPSSTINYSSARHIVAGFGKPFKGMKGLSLKVSAYFLFIASRSLREIGCKRHFREQNVLHTILTIKLLKFFNK